MALKHYEVNGKDKINLLRIKKRKCLAIGVLITLSLILLFIALALIIIFVVKPGQIKTQNLVSPICLTSHESYEIGSDSILGNFSRVAVAVDNAYCSKIGKDIIMKNGSAVDAAIASGLCNGLMNSHSAGIGGGHFMTIYLKNKNRSYVINARERAPLKSYYLMFQNRSSTEGGLATAIPGEIYGFWEAWKIGGNLPWSTLFQPAIEMCKNGFNVSKPLETAIMLSEAAIRKNIELSNIYVNKTSNKIYKQDDIIFMPKLARTLEIISEKNITAFYHDGELTRLIIEEINENGGNVSLEDFINYKALVESPIEEFVDERYKIFAPSIPSGGLIVSFIMKVMQGFGLNNQTLTNLNESSLFYHRLTETFKHAFAHRSLLGDNKNNTNIIKVIENLKSSAYINEIRSKISPFKTYPSSFYGIQPVKEDHGTAHISILANGDAVSLTSTINLYFGAKYCGKTTGIIFNNQMDDFSSPNMLNSFNLKPSNSNLIEPGKRPMSSMSPIIIVDTQSNNDVRLVLAIKNLWLNRDIKQAIDDRRVHHQQYPESLAIENEFDFNIAYSLNKLGHNITCFQYGGSVVQGISNINSNKITAACDARKKGMPYGI